MLCFHFAGGFLRRSAPNNPQPAGGILCKSFASAVSVSELPSPARSKILCGETGIRTPETLLEFTRFPGVPLQPLEHLSSRSCALKIKIGYKGTTKIAHMQIFLHFFRYFSPKSLFALVVVAAIICSTGQLNTSDRRSAT